MAVDAHDAVSGLSDKRSGFFESLIGEYVEGLFAELVAELNEDGGTWCASSCSQKGEVFTPRMLIVIYNLMQYVCDHCSLEEYS
jgi:hypothetical protein